MTIHSHNTSTLLPQPFTLSYAIVAKPKSPISLSVYAHIHMRTTDISVIPFSFSRPPPKRASCHHTCSASHVCPSSPILIHCGERANQKLRTPQWPLSPINPPLDFPLTFLCALTSPERRLLPTILVDILMRERLSYHSYRRRRQDISWFSNLQKARKGWTSNTCLEMADPWNLGVGSSSNECVQFVLHLRKLWRLKWCLSEVYGQMKFDFLKQSLRTC